LYDLLWVPHPLVAEARTDVVGRVFLADVRRQLRGPPRDRVAVHRRAVDDLLRAAAADRGGEAEVGLTAQVVLPGDGLRADVGEGHAAQVQRLPPPPFVLRVAPGVEQGEPRGAL